LEGEDKQKKIMKEIEDLTPYLSELQEFKENGLFLPPGTKGAEQPQPIYNEQGMRIDKSSKVRRKTKAEAKTELDAKALKMRVMAINKWLDERFSELFPKWALGVIRNRPWTRSWILKLFFTKVEIVHTPRPVPYGADLVTIKCAWTKYSEVRFVWEK